MKKLNKILTFFIMFFMLIGCGNTWKLKHQPDQNLGHGVTMVSVYNMGITNHQLDSICLADGLSNDFEDWVNAYFIDYETADTVYKHTFIKSMDKNGETIYVVTEWKDSLAINKRVRK